MRHLTLIQGGKQTLPKLSNVIILKTNYNYEQGLLSIIRSGPNTHVVIAQFTCTRPCLVLYFDKLLNRLLKMVPDEYFISELERDLQIFFSEKEDEGLRYGEDKTFFYKKTDMDFNQLLVEKFESLQEMLKKE